MNENSSIEIQNNFMTPEYINLYIRELLPPLTGHLAVMEKQANEEHIPIVQPEVAQWIKVFMHMKSFKNVLEIGTAIGYSTAIIARQLNEEGHITTVEIKESHFLRAKENLERLGLSDMVIQHLGDAVEVIPNLKGPFDLVFMDGAKGQYLKMLDLLEPQLAPGAVILSDNVLFRGMIANDALVKRRKKTIVKRMRTYLDFLMSDERYETALIPIGDGLAMSVYYPQKDSTLR